MMLFTELQKLVSQIPHSERVLAKKWLQRLQQPVYYTKEQRINDKYLRILEFQLVSLAQKKQQKLEYPLNLMPLDAVLTDLPEFICKKYQTRSINDVQLKKEQAPTGQNTHISAGPLQMSLVHQINEQRLEQVDKDITTLLSSVELDAHAQDKQSTTLDPPLPPPSQPRRVISRGEIQHTRSKYSDVSNSLTDSLIHAQNEQLDAEIQNLQQVQERILHDPGTELGLSNKGVASVQTAVHIKDPKDEEDACQPESGLGFIDSQAQPVKSSLRSKFFSQISNSFPVDYEQTPYQADAGSSPFIKQHSVYHAGTFQSQSGDRAQRKREIYQALVEKQEQNKELFDSVQREVREAQVQYLEERLRVLEVQLNDQDELIAQFFDCCE